MTLCIPEFSPWQTKTNGRWQVSSCCASSITCQCWSEVSNSRGKQVLRPCPRQENKNEPPASPTFTDLASRLEVWSITDTRHHRNTIPVSRQPGTITQRRSSSNSDRSGGGPSVIPPSPPIGTVKRGSIPELEEGIKDLEEARTLLLYNGELADTIQNLNRSTHWPPSAWPASPSPGGLPSPSSLPPSEPTGGASPFPSRPEWRAQEPPSPQPKRCYAICGD